MSIIAAPTVVIYLRSHYDDKPTLDCSGCSASISSSGTVAVDSASWQDEPKKMHECSWTNQSSSKMLWNHYQSCVVFPSSSTNTTERRGKSKDD